tara:strand:+ start:3838 stop:4671 length:834 start_codon:yes stop_codon:yes gene_type:complete
VKGKKTLVAGPWIGEFGWELYAWQAYIRTLSKNFDTTIIISRPNSKVLYEDFADEYIPYTPPPGLSDSFFMYDVDIKNCLYEVASRHHLIFDPNTTLFTPRRIGHPPHTHYKKEVKLGKYSIAPHYIQFGKTTKKDFDYIFHIRSRDLRKEDNWSLEKWNTLRKLLGEEKKIGCIGTKKEAQHLPETYDLRDLELKKVCDIMRNAKCAFGPSSGPMHLASLCGTPHVVWSIPRNKTRYEENWNPLKTRVKFLDEFLWHPPAAYVYEEFNKWKENENN